MQLGISLASSYPGVADLDAPRFVLERARAAAGAGLSSLTIGDHHGTGPVPYVQNVPMLARLLAEWDERPTGLLFLVPVWHPVLMAEQIGTLAAIAEGPFIVQTGLGRRGQIKAMGLDVAHRAKVLERNIGIVKALLAGDHVSDDELGLHEVCIAPRPPRELEWWIGAAADAALDRAARLGDGWYADAGVDGATAGSQMQSYIAACERHGRDRGRTVVRKDVFISDDDRRGVEIGQGLIDQGYRGMRSAASVAFGGVERVAEQLSVFADLGFDEVVIRTMVGIDQDEAVRSIELAGDVARELV